MAGVLTCDGTAGPENQAPQAAGRIPDQVVQVDSTAVLDLRADFSDPEGDTLTYAASSGAPATATVTVSGSALSVTGLAAGEAMVTVTARDPDGLAATQSFAVNVTNQAPVIADTIPDGEVFVDSLLVFDAAVYFADPDGDTLTYTAVSSDTTRATAAVSGSMVTVTGMAVGSTTVTVTARDPGGLDVAQSFSVTVPNQAPVAVGTINDRAVEAGRSFEVDMEDHFSDPDGDALDHAATSSDPTRATAEVSGSVVTVTGVAGGSATILVTALDSAGLSAEHRFGVTVPNQAPQSLAAIEDQAVAKDASTTLYLSPYFSDPDGDDLTYSAGSSDQSIATVSVSGATLTLTGIRPGTVTVTATVSDPAELSVTGSFELQVVEGNLPPRAVGKIGDPSLETGDTLSIDVSSSFTDPEGESLSFTASSSRQATATVALSGSTLAVTAVAEGTATIRVTARDPSNLSAVQRFDVTVGEAMTVSDLVVTAASANPDILGPGESFSLKARVHNRGPGGASSVTTLRYYRSTDENISTGDIEVGTDGVPVLGPSGNSAQSLDLTASSSVGTYYYGACVDPVGNESESNNNCSGSVTVQVTTSNRAPRAVGTISGKRLDPGDTVAIDVDPHFSDPDGDSLTYTAVSSNPAAASVALSGSSVTATAVAVGTATITVTATDPDGLTANQRFAVTVQAPGQSDLVVQPPGANPNSLGPGEILRLSVVVQNQGTGDASSGTTLRYYSSLDATISAADNQVGTDNVPELGASETSAQSIVLAAPSTDGIYYYGACADTAGNESSTDNNCSNAVEVEVVVPNQSPRAVGTISNRSVGVGNSVSVEVESYFTDPDNDDLTYTATSDSTTLVTVTVSGSSVELTGVAAGQTTVTVRATDPGNLSATQNFTVTVAEGNLPPRVDVPIADFDAVPDGVVYIFTLTEYFSDPDGDDLTWAVSSSNTDVASPKILVDTLDLTTGETGRANIIVTATDPDGLFAADTFTVTVTTGVNQAPTVDVPIADFDAEADGVVYIFTLTEYFSDPDG
ncbi:MAG: Ig-like domain-containing protein, partial [Gemmatimonadota bacterium]|nr:Ig-like domain-containing protein [Gemmatimonadota bacterium]